MKFHVLALVASFCVGMVFVIMYTPKPTVVIKFPTPESSKRLYRGDEGTCYRLQSEEVACPADRRNVLPQPVSEDESTDPLLKFFSPA